jgi:hypothetical protein
MGIRIQGNTSGNFAEVDAANQLKITLGKALDTAGYTVAMYENDSGSLVGTPYNKSPEISHDYRLRAGIDTILFNDIFNYAAQDTGRYLYRSSTLTAGWAGGFLSLNSSSITTAGQAVVQTYRTFNVDIASLLYVETSIELSAVVPSNWQAEVGVFQAGTAAPYAPTDGVFFRINSTGIFGVINYNGTEITTAYTYPASSVNPNRIYKLALEVGDTGTDFYVNDAYIGTLATGTSNPLPTIFGGLPWSARLTQPSAAGAICQLKIGALMVSLGDWQTAKPWNLQMTNQGLAYQGLAGSTMGTNALFTNSLAPTAGAAMTNTTAALGTGLGGQFSSLPTLTANTDGIICSFLNPIGSVSQRPRTLIISGVHVYSIVTTVLVGGPVINVYSIAYGHNALSLATAEASTTKAPRRVPVGVDSGLVANAAVGVMGNANGIHLTLANPIVVNPGEYVQLVSKNIGTVTTTGVVTYIVTFDHYFE